MRFMRQSRTIKVTNLDGKVQTDKEMRKHDDIYTSSADKLRQDERTDTPVGKSLRRTIRECVHVLEIAATEISILANLLAPIEENGYFTFSNNSNIIDRGASEFHFYF